MSLDTTLLELAASQHGMFTTASARAVGYAKEALVALVRAKVLLHPGRGLYAVASLVDADAPEWELRLAYGATLLYDDVAMTSATALKAHGIALWNTEPDKPQLVRPIWRSASMQAFSMRPRPLGETVDTDWGPTVPVATALVQHCIDHGVARGIVSADDALHRRLVTLDELQLAVAAADRWPRSSRAGAMLTYVNPLHESPGESLTNFFAASHEIELVPQVRIFDEGGRLVARVDFLVKGTKVVVEFDGRVKYDDRDALWKEKQREDQLRALGYVVVRLTWSDVMKPSRLAAKIKAGLRLAESR